MGRPRTALVIPTLNEEEGIGHALREVPGEWIDEVIVADGGSTDLTVAVAEAAGARVIAAGRGYGRACLEGARAASPDAEILVFLDGNGSDRPDLIPLLVEPIASGAHDFVIGSRARGEREPGSMRAHQLMTGRAIGGALGLLYGVRYTDMAPFRAIRREALERLGTRELTYGWNLEMQMRAARAGLRVLEVPVAHRRRRGGASKVSGSIQGTLKAGTRILATLARVGLEPRLSGGRGPSGVSR